MNSSLSSFLISKNIFVKGEYLASIPNYASMTHAQTFNYLLNEDLMLYVDKDKAKSHIDLSRYDFSLKVELISNKVIFAQLTAYSNIAEPLNKEKNEDNLDVLEKTESKYLQGDDETGRKVERFIYKFQLTDGVTDFYGFEYELLNNLQSIVKDKSPKFPKVMIGPNIEIRRGIFYFKKNNFQVVDEMK